MRHLLAGVVAMLGVAATAGVAHAAIIVSDLGTGAPPATVGGYTMIPFPNDVRPVINNVNNVPTTPIGGMLGFSVPLSHREIGNGWGTWSHGYTGDVYRTNGAVPVTMSLPADTGAFYFYAEPDPFNVFNITATANDGTTLTLPVNGNAGARGWGFHTTGGTTLSSITVSSPVQFAVGEFGIARAVPEPLSIAVFGGLAAVGGLVARRRRMT